MNNIASLLATLLCVLLACSPAMALAEPEAIHIQSEAVDGIDIPALAPDERILDGEPIPLSDDLALAPNLDGPLADIDAPAPESDGNGAGLADNADSDFIIRNGVLTQYTGRGGRVTIPNYLGIKVIGNNAFSTRNNLTGIVIPRGVVTIEYNAFYNCVNLTSVVLPKGLVTIEKYAFHGDAKLTSVSIPSTVKSIGEGAFALCSGLREANIPVGIKTIAPFLFFRCNHLSSMTVPETVKKLEKYAFAGCYRMKRITVYPTRTTIDDKAFDEADPQFFAYKGYSTYDWALKHGLNVAEITASKDPAVLSSASLVMKAGRTHTLKIRQRAGRRVSWESSDRKVATVLNGKITARGVGTCIVTATFENGKTLSCKVRVNN